jgi:hypothetical protein
MRVRHARLPTTCVENVPPSVMPSVVPRRSARHASSLDELEATERDAA